MTNPVFNLGARLVDKNGFLLAPWNSFFQQFTQNAPAVQNLVVGSSPFNYTPNARGKVIISGGVVSAIALSRGKIIIPLSIVRPLIVPMAISDTLSVTFTVVPVIQFLGD